MILLKAKNLGVADGISTTILAAATIDNAFCITAFSVAATLAATHNGGDKAGESDTMRRCEQNAN